MSEEASSVTTELEEAQPAERLYKPHPDALAQLAIGTCVVIASLLALPDSIALIPNAPTATSWMLRLIGVWLSAAVLWFVGFLGILHCIRLLVKGVEVRNGAIKLWRFARPIAWKNVDAIAVEPQYFFSKVFSLKPVARRLTIFESKKSWRKADQMNLVPHHLPSFFFAPPDFSRLCTDIAKTKFDVVPQSNDGILADVTALPRLRAVYKMFRWQRVGITILISFGLVTFLSRKAIVHYQYNAGNKAMAAHEYDKAKEMYATAVSVDPTFAVGWNNLAIVEFEQGNFAASQEHWARALFYKPDFVEAKLSLAYMNLQARHFQKARELIDSSLNLAHENIYGMVQRADLELRLGKIDDAIRDANAVLAADPVKNKIPRYTAACILAQANIAQGHYDEAESILKTMAPMPNPKAHTGENITLRVITTAQLRRATGKFDQAQKLIDIAMLRAPQCSDVYLEKAKLALAKRDFARAATTINTVTGFASDNPWAYILKAQLLELTREPAESVSQTLTKALACPNQDSESLAESAVLYEALKDYPKAIECAQSSLKIYASNAVAQKVLDQTMEQANKG